MQTLSIAFLTLLITSTFAQTTSLTKPTERKGFVFGVGVGAGMLNLSVKDSVNTSQSTFTPTLPNIKIGFMVTNRLAILALLPGANYKYKNKNRGFESLQIAAQYWPKDRWWLLGATGVTFDAPAFYTVKDPKKAEFYTGFPSVSLATGYEIWKKGRFTIDLQYRAFYGKSNLSGGYREGFSNMIIAGINWY